MKNTFTRALLAAAITSLPLSPISAANYTWTGPGTDMTTAANWGGTTPTAADTGTFAGATPTNPLVQYTGTPLTFNAAGLIYSFGSGSYSVGVDAANVFNGAVVSIGASGVTNNSGAAQTIGIVNGANFGIVAGSLDSTSSATGGITYSIGSGTDTVRSTLVTQANASLGDASILVNGSSSLTPGNQNFLRIQDATNLQSASLVAGSQGEIFINTSIATSTADVSLSGGSLLIINQPITLNNLISGTSTDSIVLAANVILNNTTANNIQGVISGAGAFISNSGSVGVNNSSNSYTGGTFVEAGTLIGSTTSIPVAATQPSITIDNAATFQFNQTGSGSFAGDIVISTANGILQSNGPGNLEIIGQITGNGKLLVSEGELTLTRPSIGPNNTYSGGSEIINGSTLIGDTNSLQGVVSINDGNLTFVQTTDGTFNGTFTGFSGDNVNKTGTGTLNLAFPTPMFFGQTNVQQGTLNLVSTYLGGDVEVNSGTFLTGIGQIGGNLAVLGGTVSPGNSIGTILVSGNYTQNATGIYEVEINGAGQSDLIVVEDSAVLAGTVSVISLDGVINPANNYVIMHVDGSITGEFQNVVTESPSIVAAVYYIDDTVNGGVNVILKIETLFSSLAYTSNEIQVANQLNSITNPTPELQAMLDALTLLGTTDPEAATLALDQMTGQQYTNLVVAAEISTHQFIRRLYDPLRSIVTTYPCNCYDSCCEPCPTLDLWIEGGGGRTFIEGTANTRGFHTDGYEVTGGVQSTFKRDWTVGLAGSYVKDTVSYNVGGSGKKQTGYAGIYGLYRPANFYVLADGVFGYTENKVRRFISIGDLAYTSNSKPTTYQGSGYIEAGIDCPWNCMLLQPFLGFEASYYNRKGFTETGANPLNLVVSKKSHTNVFSRLGAHLTTNQLPYNLSLSVDLAWQYRITSLGNSINERFQSFGDNFTIKGLHFRRSSVDAAATITAVVFDNWQLYLEASGERWSRASTYNFLGGVKFSW